MDRQLVFLLYDSRSGSTLLSALLNCYAGVSVSQETAFIPAVLEYPLQPDRSSLDHLFDKLEREVQFQELELDRGKIRQQIEDAGSWSREGVIMAVLAEYFARRDGDTPVWVIKSPRMFFHTKRILDLFPAARFVHIIRDGRAVFNSKRTMRSVHGRLMQNNLVKAARDWKCRIERARKLGDRCLEIRYEELLESPECVLESLLDYFGVDANSRLISKSQGDYSKIIGGKQKHLHRNVSGKPNVRHSVKWQQELLPEDILLYEWLVGDQLQALGYSLVYVSDSPSAALRIKAEWRMVYYLLHQGCKYISNLYWHVFVDRSFFDKCRAKIHEIRS